MNSNYPVALTKNKSSNYFLTICLIALSFLMQAQLPGDTIFVKAFKYGSTTRDTSIQFPPSNLTYEKIILKYNMRCKNNLVSTQASPNQGCGEWDYSCNTFIVDSSETENELNTAPKYVISHFTGNTFNYTSAPLYDYFNYSQTQVALNNIVSETQFTVGAGAVAVPNVLKSNERSGHSQVLYTAAELVTAGFSAGNMDGFLMDVANAGGAANFMKVGIQHTNQTSLNASAVTLTGFTNVYNASFTFTAGSNRIQFHTPFNWDGTSNILIDYSFTNTGLSTPIVFNGTATSTVMALYANNNYALDLSAMGHVNLNTTALAAINNELSISFWAYGTASLMPSGTSILYAYGSTPTSRDLNIHLPWDNNEIYFDCGFTNGNFDRIQKASTAAEQGGQWHHWAFVKNATTGTMNIYLNGNVWQSGTGKTKAISILNLILGKNNELTSNYKGKINELSIWSKSLTMGEIQTWMRRPIDATHPQYANLVGYYKMDEGTGLTITDSKNNLSSTGVNLQWNYERGNRLNRTFFQTNNRPNLILVQGTYAITTTTVIVKDSVQRNPNIVQEYSVTSNAAVFPVIHDGLNLVSTVNLYQATPMNVYDGETGLLITTIPVTAAGSLSVTTLNYYKRYPFYNELLSFVTPYGKGLSLGPKGKTWYYDITDFAPLLKGKKRFLMSMGGEFQEQMDIDFWFIVGTPPRNVVEFKQLWQGAARLGGIGIASVNNDSRFTTLNVPIHPSAQKFKVRSTITGHGSHGEFGQNGGVVTHYFNVNGGPNEFSWPITMKCGVIPVYPQGGTWIYNRQGWCPGETSLTTENDITPFVTPGTTATLDYNCSNPQVPGGDYRYLVAHQLVSYSGANHNLDAAIEDVLAPSTKVLYSRKNPICTNPVLLVRNTGSTPITSLDLEYWVNTANQKESFQWIGNLGYMDTVTITLPIGTLWTQNINPSNNKFHAEIKLVNGMSDDYTFNNMYHSDVTLPDVLPNDIVIEFKTNNNPFENTCRLIDESGNDLTLSQLTAANTTYSDPFTLIGCYKLIVEDYGGDGLQFWGNTAQGSGFVRIKNSVGTVLKSFLSDFGSYLEYNFSTMPLNYVSVKEQAFANSIRVYPNPAHGKFHASGSDLENSEIKMTDVLGRTVEAPVSKDKTGLVFDVSHLKAGVYLVTITKGNETAVKKIVVN